MKLISTQEAGKKLGISRRRVCALIAADRLPAVKIGRDWIIKEKDLEKVAVRKPGRPKWRPSEKGKSRG